MSFKKFWVRSCRFIAFSLNVFNFNVYDLLSKYVTFRQFLVQFDVMTFEKADRPRFATKAS